MLPAWYLRATYFSDKWHNCHEKFAPKKAKKKTSKTKAAMLRKCREKQHMPRKSGNAANAFAAIQKRQQRKHLRQCRAKNTQKSGNAA